MWATCVALLWALEDTGALAVASRAQPVDPASGDRLALTGATTAQVLGGLVAALPALAVLLIAAGALRPLPSPSWCAVIDVTRSVTPAMRHPDGHTTIVYLAKGE